MVLLVLVCCHAAFIPYMWPWPDTITGSACYHSTRSDPLKLCFFCSSHSRVYLDPCLPSDIRIKGTHEGMKYRLKGLGNFEICRERLLPLLNNTATCGSPPCSLNGVHQPHISFNSTEFYGFSEFWYSVNDVLRLKGVYDAEAFNRASKVSRCFLSINSTV